MASKAMICQMIKNCTARANAPHNRMGRCGLLRHLRGAVIAQTIIRYAAYIFIAWLVLTSADGWVMAWIAK